MRAALLVVLLAGCTPPAKVPPPLGELPAPSELPVRDELPALFDSFNSEHVATTTDAWTGWRRGQLVQLFDHYVYGKRPAVQSVAARKLAALDGVVAGASWEEWELTLGEVAGARLFVAVIRPDGIATPPVIVGLNKCGNQSLVADARVRATTSFVMAACGGDAESTRGVQAGLWPLTELVARGVAVVTFHESDAAPDDAERFTTSLRSHFRPEGEARTVWGTIALWAWALAHVGQWVDTQPFDTSRTAVFGHSRRGKAALLTGAVTTSFDAVIAHQSGTGGAALNRSLEGETIELINLAFPHWFNDVYPGFSNAEARTPVDQHQLLALWAPRQVVIVDGEADRWADPDGARAAVEAARPAWRLFGEAQAERLTWRSRPGDHSVLPSDWTLFLDTLGW